MNHSSVPSRFVVAAWLCIAAALWLAPMPASAQPTLVSKYSFTTQSGADPDAGLVQGRDGRFYGTTSAGGSSNKGTVFKVSATGALTTLVNFTGTNGANPSASLVYGSDGRFYGVTRSGGSSNKGTVFTITPTGTLTTLHNFSATSASLPNANSDGVNPNGLVLGRDGRFYGTTQVGGSNGTGTVFKITSSGAFITLYSFSVFDGDGDDSDGANPNGLVLGRDGNFYGTTSGGAGPGIGYGTVFKMTPSGTLTTLVTFNGANGNGPMAGLVQGRNGNFYGTTGGGMDDMGTVFKVTPAGTLTTLVNFNGANGIHPEAPLFEGRDGNFYGTTHQGGSPDDGTVFKMTPSGTLTTLVIFTGTNGALPFAGLVQGRDGNFYGTTENGGATTVPGDDGSGDGTVFKMTPAGALTTLVNFSGASGAKHPSKK